MSPKTISVTVEGRDVTLKITVEHRKDADLVVDALKTVMKRAGMWGDLVKPIDQEKQE